MSLPIIIKPIEKKTILLIFNSLGTSSTFNSLVDRPQEQMTTFASMITSNNYIFHSLDLLFVTSSILMKPKIVSLHSMMNQILTGEPPCRPFPAPIATFIGLTSNSLNIESSPTPLFPKIKLQPQAITRINSDPRLRCVPIAYPYSSFYKLNICSGILVVGNKCAYITTSQYSKKLNPKSGRIC